MAMQVIADVLPALGLKLTTTSQKLWWSKIAVIGSSILVTLASLFVAWLGKAGHNSYIVLLIFGCLAAPINAILLISLLPFFGKTGKKSILIGTVCGILMSIFLLGGILFDKMDRQLSPIIGNKLPLTSNCTLDQNATTISEMFQMPESCKLNNISTCNTVKQKMEVLLLKENGGDYESVELENFGEEIIGNWNFAQKIYRISSFARIAVIVGFTILSTKIAHWCLGEKNDPIGEIPVLD